jgi:hypothetical protein
VVSQPLSYYEDCLCPYRISNMYKVELRGAGRSRAFCRWLKGVLSCRPLLRQRENGVPLQVDGAIIASLLLSLWAGRPPTMRHDERLCCYLRGWACDAEVIAPIDRWHVHSPPASTT